MKKYFLTLAAAASLRASDFPAPYNTEPDQSGPMPAQEAARRMKLPPGFKATVFAAEPDIQNPIAMAWDGKGRLWVAENYTYAERPKKFELNLRDRLLIFEDKDGDGHFDSRKVFSDELQMLASVEIGHGGVWLMCPPRLLFVPDRDGDDRPDGPAQVLLDGFTPSPDNHHTFANGLRFGPDGWLYGRCGASSHGEIGAPGTVAEARIPIRGGIWRYHPVRKVFEVLNAGTTNPWGHDWDDHGELFFINTVNGHLWHGITGAHYERPHTIDPNPHTYALIDQHADHYHFDVAGGWGNSRAGKADGLGGGHAHIGAMIYLGDNWPDEYRGHLFTLNLHGRRVNQDILERQGSGYVGHHASDFMVAADPWFRGMEISYGPDGGVFVLDWSDTGECHDINGVHRTSGRIYKITHGDPKQPQIGDLAKLPSSELVKLQEHRNEWFARRARVELATRGAANSFAAREREDTARRLHSMFESQKDAAMKLRALWALYVIGEADQEFLRARLNDPDEHIRVWAIRLLSDTWSLDTVMSKRPVLVPEGRIAGNAKIICNDFARLGKSDPSGLARLALASTLQRLSDLWRLPTATALLARAEDTNDHNLPLLIWYGLIPIADGGADIVEELAEKCELPLIRKFVARRLAEDIEKQPQFINQLIKMAAAKPPAFQRDILEGMAEAWVGWRKAAKPDEWDAFSAKVALSNDESLKDQARKLSVVFGDGRAVAEIKKIAFDANADLAARKAALQALIDSKPPDLREICEGLLSVRFLNPVAARGLAGFDDPAVGAKLARAYSQFHQSERPQLLATLVSRASFASALLDGIAANRIPRSDLSVFHARQIRAINDPALNKKLAEVWGELRDTPGQSQQLVSKWRHELAPATLAKADPSQGRVVYNQICAACHTLHGEGGKVGPDLTGSGRDNLDYLLENIVDPSAVVTADFRMSVLELKDGRVLTGIITAKTEQTITLKTMTETITTELAEVASNKLSAVSIMPEGLLDSLTADQACDLIAYLMQPAQVPLPLSAKIVPK